MRKTITIFIAILLLLAGCTGAPAGSSPSAEPTVLETPMLTPQPTPQAQVVTFTADEKQIRADMDGVAQTLTENYAYASGFDGMLWAEYTDMLVEYFAENAFSPEAYVQIIQGILDECLPINQVSVLDNSAYAGSDVSNSQSDAFYSAFSYIAQTPGAEDGNEQKTSGLTTHILENGKIGYVDFAAFSEDTIAGDAYLMRQFFADAQDSKTLILDVRSITGNSYDYWTQNIVSLLSDQSYDFQTISLVKDGLNNRAYMNDFVSRDGEEYAAVEGSDALTAMENLDTEQAAEMAFVKSTANAITPAEDSIGYKGQIYVLADERTPSAFVDFCRQSGFATVIGGTAGNATQGASYVPYVLPGTGMVIRYAPELLLNADGSAAYLQGASPDIAVDPNAALEQCLNIAAPDADAEEIARSVKPMNPIVTIQMDNGDIIKAELYPEVAPNTVANFVTLIQSGFYDGTIFHRVIPGFMVQGGDPDGTGMGGPDYSIKGEFTSNGVTNTLAHDRGVLSMARSQHMDSAGSQFFIMVATATHLDGAYAGFGKVTEGMDAVDRIVNQPTGANDRPATPPVMEKVTVETGGVNYSVEKLQGIR